MQQKINRLSKHKNWIFLVGIIVIFFCFRQWLLESVWIDGIYTNNISTEKEVLQQLEPNRWYTQSFYCSGPRLQKMNLY